MRREHRLLVGLFFCFLFALGVTACGPRMPLGAVPRQAQEPFRSERLVPQSTPTPAHLPILEDDGTGTTGLFLGAVCPPRGPLPCLSFAQMLRHHIALGTGFVGWSADLMKFMHYNGMDQWPQQQLVPEITWMATGVTYADINAGKYDAYLTQQAQELKSFGYPVFLRPFHEFNGFWYPWGLPNQGAGPGADTAFIAAWQRMVRIFRGEGASNVKFVWCFSSSGLHAIKNEPWDNPAKAYPGDAFVDWISFDGYDRGDAGNPKAWQTFDQIFQQAYQLSVSISPHKPISISEVGVNEYGDGGFMKAAWIQTMFSELLTSNELYPNLRLVSWFEADSGYQYDTESSDPAYMGFVLSIRPTYPKGLLRVRSNGIALARLSGL